MKKEKISPQIMTVITVGVSAGLLVICSWIGIPAIGPFVPFTLQTFAIFLIAGLFSVKESMMAVTVYIALGIIGIPVFSGFKSGISVILGSTEGYIVGFVLAVLIIGLFKKIKSGSVFVMVSGMIVGLMVCYIFGTIWFYFVYMQNNDPMGILKILSLCVFPFIIPDILKMTVAVVLVEKLSLPLSKIGFAEQKS